MDISKILQDHSENIEEIVEKAMSCKSPNELLEIANEYGIEIDAAQAEEIFKQFKQPSLLTGDELAQVAGGKAFTGYCPQCGSTDISHDAGSRFYHCNTCNYYYPYYCADVPRN